MPHNHPSKDQLMAFGHGTLAALESCLVEQHLEVCQACCETLLNLKDDTFVGLVRAVKPRMADTSSDTTAESAKVNSSARSSNDSFALKVNGFRSEAIRRDTSELPECPPELREHPRYRIIALVGRGGMGSVYRAEHLLMQRSAAIKVINPELVRHPTAVERFRREVQAAAKLSHPNIVAAWDAEQAGNLHLLVMEFVDGTDLATIVQQQGPLDVEKTCSYIAQAASGLQHAHEKGMVHRDIKPHNLMLTPDGRVRILDFGLAGIVTGNNENPVPESANVTSSAVTPQHLTSFGSVMGTPDYMAPEQAVDAHSADIRSDIYSLGCTLSFLLTGKPPFEAEGVAAKLKAHAQDEPDSLPKLRKDVPPELSRVAARMLAKNPAERFQTPAEVVAALEPWTHVDRRKTRVSAWIFSGIVLCLMVLAGVIVVVTNRGQLEIQSEVEDVRVIVRKGGEQIEIFDLRTGSQVKWLPSGDYELDVISPSNDVTLDRTGFQLSRWGREIVKAKLVAAEVAVNLITDPSFENTALTQLPNGWRAWLNDGQEFRCEVVSGGHTGQRSLQISGKGTRGVVFGDDVKADRTKRFALKGWVKFEGDKDARAVIKFNYFRGSEFLGVHDLVGATVDQPGWHLFEKTDVLDVYPTADHFYAMCHIEGSGTGWFDDLELIAYDRDKLPHDFEARHGRHNRLHGPNSLHRWVGTWDTGYAFHETDSSSKETRRAMTMVSERTLGDYFLMSYSRAKLPASEEQLQFLLFDQNLGAFRQWIFSSNGKVFEWRGPWNNVKQALELRMLPDASNLHSSEHFVDDNHIETKQHFQYVMGQKDAGRWTATRTAANGKVEIPVSTSHVAEPTELSQLNKFAGEWTIHVTYKPSVWNPQSREETIRETSVWILGGRFLMTRAFNEKDELTSIWMATGEPGERSNRFWFFNADGSSGEWRLTWDEASSGFHFRAIDTPSGWTGTGFNRWVNEDMFDNQALIKDEKDRVLLDMTQERRRKK